jgi:hypothetical protein
VRRNQPDQLAPDIVASLGGGQMPIDRSRKHRRGIRVPRSGDGAPPDVA